MIAHQLHTVLMCPACRMLQSCCANSCKRCMLKYGSNRRATAVLSTHRHGVPLRAARQQRRRSWLCGKLRPRSRRFQVTSGAVVDWRGQTSKTRPISEFSSAHTLADGPTRARKVSIAISRSVQPHRRIARRVAGLVGRSSHRDLHRRAQTSSKRVPHKASLRIRL